MKFLLEADEEIIDQKETITTSKARNKELVAELFKNSKSQEEKYDLIDEWIEGHPNSQYIKDAKLAIQHSAFDSDSLEAKRNPLVAFLNDKRLKWNLSQDHADLIYNLAVKDQIKPNDEWLFRQELYNGDKNASLYKIKTFAFINNKDLLSQFGDPNSISMDDFYIKPGKLKNIDEFRSILKNFQTKSPKDKTKTPTEKAQIEIKSEKIIKDPRIQNAAQALKQFGLRDSQIGNMLASVDLLPEDSSESYITKLFQSLGK